MPHRRTAALLPAALTALATTMLAGCGASAVSPDPSRILHIENRTSSAIVASGSMTDDPDDPGFDVIVQACGGMGRVLPASASKTDASGKTYSVGIAMDPTGALDAAIERQNGNLTQVAIPSGTMTIAWSRGALPISALPQWITVSPAGVTMTPQPDPAATACASWAPPSQPAGPAASPSG